MTDAKTQRNPQTMNRLAKLRTVPVSKIQNIVIEIIGVTIKELSNKDKERALYVLGSVLNDVRVMTNGLTKSFEKIQLGVKKLIEEIEKEPDKKIAQKEILNRLIEIVAIPAPEPEKPIVLKPDEIKEKVDSPEPQK